MPAKLILAPEAEQDIADAYAWYEDHRPGLGEEFLGSVEAALEAIRRTPETYSKVFEDFRRALLRRFPYAIFYERGKNSVTVYGVLHTSRDPAKWRKRLG
jgi:plasmid stabilization system protein ParE